MDTFFVCSLLLSAPFFFFLSVQSMEQTDSAPSALPAVGPTFRQHGPPKRCMREKKRDCRRRRHCVRPVLFFFFFFPLLLSLQNIAGKSTLSPLAFRKGRTRNVGPLARGTKKKTSDHGKSGAFILLATPTVPTACRKNRSICRKHTEKRSTASMSNCWYSLSITATRSFVLSYPLSLENSPLPP